MKCTCDIDCCADEIFNVTVCEDRMSRGDSFCSECGHKFLINESYEYLEGIHEGEKGVFRTCKDCISLSDQFFSSGRNLGLIQVTMFKFVTIYHR